MSVVGEAHGRVNLIGEHTDYNGGWVLPTTIPQKTRVVLDRHADRDVIATTEIEGEEETESFVLGESKKRGTWLDYVMGAVHLLQGDGHKLAGFAARIESAVPVGSGLSSSAALEVSMLKALRSAFDLKIDDVEIARLGQRIENDFVGARVGIMDQMACALAKEGEALFLDTLNLSYERITLPRDLVELIVINSGVAHQHSSGGYNKRRSECEEACKALGVPMLRELGEKDLRLLDSLPDTLMRRARHVITENARVHSAVKAIRSRDMKTLGKLFDQSHASMRDDYEVSVSQVDHLVELCSEHEGVFGARLTGGGFGGSIVALAAPRTGRAIAEKVVAEYNKLGAAKASVLVAGW